MNWHIHTGQRSRMGVGSAIELIVGRLEYMAAHPQCSREQLLAEATVYARLLRGWIREHEPKPQVEPWTCDGSIESMSRQVSRPGAKTGPMSDG